MAKILAEDTSSRPRATSFPAEFFDGTLRLLVAGEDFAADRNVESAARAYRKQAQNMGFQGFATTVDNKSFKAKVTGRRAT